MLQSYFSAGKIYKIQKGLLQLRIFTVKDLIKVIEHFDQFPLLTQKKNDYKLFKQAITIIKNKEHLTKEGLVKIVQIRASLNKGLSASLKSAFPSISTLKSRDLDLKLPNLQEELLSKDPAIRTGSTLQIDPN